MLWVWENWWLRYVNYFNSVLARCLGIGGDGFTLSNKAQLYSPAYGYYI